MQRLVDYIYQEKYNGKIQRLIKSAKLRFPQANRQGVIYASRGLNRELIENLFSGQYIGLHQSIILQGFTGSGKTYLACALGKEACLNHVRVRYVRLPDLLMEYKEALNHAFDEPKQWEIREINEIMNQSIDRWRYFPNPRMFSEYGRQKGWERENPATDSSNLSEKTVDGFVEVTEQMELPF
ncbi:hypothetical protein B5F29_10005 [Lachnoclostridium sp. An196]|nr:hypothetical protein B5F29_10005 [Lachnoclostridium sp. An196]